MGSLEKAMVESCRDSVRQLSETVGQLPARVLASLRWQAAEMLRLVDEEEARRGQKLAAPSDA